MNLKLLEDIGLTDTEANVYITLLKIGNTSTGEIIKQANVSRSKVYDVLERLKKKGFVTEVIKLNVRHFEATSPKRITKYLQNKKDKLTTQIHKTKPLIKELQQLQSLHLEKQEAKIYTGIEGWKALYDDILDTLKKGDEYVAFGIGKEEMNNQTINRFIHKFHLKRAEKGIKARVLVSSKTNMKKFSTFKHYQYKFTKTKFPTNIAIYKNNVITLVWGQTPVAFVINSKQVAQKYKKFFESIWQST